MHDEHTVGKGGEVVLHNVVLGKGIQELAVDLKLLLEADDRVLPPAQLVKVILRQVQAGEYLMQVHRRAAQHDAVKGAAVLVHILEHRVAAEARAVEADALGGKPFTGILQHRRQVRVTVGEGEARLHVLPVAWPVEAQQRRILMSWEHTLRHALCRRVLLAAAEAVAGDNEFFY